MEDSSEFPYELNATYYGALDDEANPKLGEKRFLCSQAVALSMKGIPAVYFHSLIATPNYQAGVKDSGHNRTINRRKWNNDELSQRLMDENCNAGYIFEWYTRVLRKRSACPAFHPDASQEIIKFSDSILAIERISTDGTQRILCLFNFTAQDSPLHDQDKILSYFPNESAKDLLKGSEIFFPKGIYLSVLIKPFGFVLIEYHSSRKKQKVVCLDRQEKIAIHILSVLKAKKGDSIDVGVKMDPKEKPSSEKLVKMNYA